MTEYELKILQEIANPGSVPDLRWGALYDAQKATCSKCGAIMTPGKALAQTVTAGAPDFPGDKHGSTMSMGGPGKLVDCLKCPKCGGSITA